MTTIKEIEVSLSGLSTDELHSLERLIHDLYPARNEPIIYDDAYGLWTEYGQRSAVSEVFELLDRQEDVKRDANASAR
jgi:hypothetical protein